ncbi:MAG: molybdate ABC transporter substrate-binding protein [Deltaproteobacteria bacterium]|nr:molybdate ABC transporter substrate-binding protein [Deltaproteobacteria bacterium]
MSLWSRRRALAVLCLAWLASPRVSAEDPKPIRVFAASSLKEAFGVLARAYPHMGGVPVELQLAGSQELRTQIEQGAPCDVFAPADLAQLKGLDARGFGEPATFARNALTIAVPLGNPARVRALADLSRVKRVVVGAAEVPVGAYTRELFERFQARLGAAARGSIERNIVSREANVRQVLAKVTLGEADAAIVYRTDAQALQGQVEAVPIAPELQPEITYPIAASSAAGRAFVEFVLGAAGQKALRDAGFSRPDEPPGRK